MDQGISVPGVTEQQLLEAFRRYSNNPSAMAADMFATLNAQRERQRVVIVLTAGRGVWTFPRPFPDGVIPVVGVEIETPDVTDYLLEAKIIAGSTTSRKTEFQVNRFYASQTLGTTLTAVVGTVLRMFEPATGVGSVTINGFAEAALS